LGVIGEMVLVIGIVPGITLSEILVRDIADYVVFVQLFVIVIAGIAGFENTIYIITRGNR